MEAQAALENAEARLAAVRAVPSTETAPPQEELEVPPLEGPEPWESEADQADLPPPPPPSALPGGEPSSGDLPPAPTDGAPQLPGTILQMAARSDPF